MIFKTNGVGGAAVRCPPKPFVCEIVVRRFRTFASASAHLLFMRRGPQLLSLTFRMREKQRMCFGGIRTTFKEGTNVYKAAMCIKHLGTNSLT